MEKSTAGLVGVLAALATIGTAQAAARPPAQTPEQVMHVSSYSDLLSPIANASELLKTSNAKLLDLAPLKAQPVQYYQDEQPRPDYQDEQPRPDYRHHHHHHHYYPPPPPPHHHHHHHHQSGLNVVIPGFGVVRN